MKKKKLVVLSGAGMSAESGIRTFREMGGLWEEYDISEVATPEAWARNPELVLRFYNERRRQLGEVEPNQGHLILAELEKDFDVHIVTQNVDNLHERAGSSNVLHLHGELSKVRSEHNENLLYDVGTKSIELGEKAEDGSQLRPHVVWFGESVPAIEEAVPIVQSADVFLVIGTSLNVYPAAGLIMYTPKNIPKFLIDPNYVDMSNELNFKVIQKMAGEGMEELKNTLLKN